MVEKTFLTLGPPFRLNNQMETSDFGNFNASVMRSCREDLFGPAFKLYPHTIRKSSPSKTMGTRNWKFSNSRANKLSE